MKQSDLTVIVDIKSGQEQALRSILSGLQIDFGRMRTVHYAAFLILPSLGVHPPRLVLETNYDGDLESHLNELTTLGTAPLRQVYECCEGYPPNGATGIEVALRQYLNTNRFESSAFFVAFPGRSVGDISNAIAVHREAKRFLDKRRRDPTSGFDQWTQNQVFAELVEHFRSRSKDKPVASDTTRQKLKWRAWLNVLLLLAFLPVIVLLCLIARIHEKREARAPKPYDPTLHDEVYDGMNVGPQNHLCTLAMVTPSRFRICALRVVLFLVQLAASKVYVLGKLGSIATIHFARWVLIDDGRRHGRPGLGGRYLLFFSNYDGSWPSYLGDFSDQGFGINALWSHTVAFTPTQYMVCGGAYNLEPYEDGVVTHFHKALLFYSAYPDYPVRNIGQYLDFRDKLAGKIAQMQRRGKSLTRTSKTVERSDIQGIVASGYKHLNYARFVFLKVRDAHNARKWLSSVADSITRAEHPGDKKPDTCVNIAFTWEGLKAFAPCESLHGFPHEFKAGMNREEAALILGDTGASAQEHWKLGGCKTEPLHILLMLYAVTPQHLSNLATTICGSKEFAQCLDTVAKEETARENNDLNEPFGFRDGISQPKVMGLTRKTDDPIKTGEFVLGYENELGLMPRVPTIDRELVPGDLLPDHPDDPKQKAFGRNGTYLVFRRLAQDVDGFERFIHANSDICGGNPQLFAAKLMGRWRSGAPLVLAPYQDNPRLTNRNDFFFSHDPDGVACPIGSHIRRANPRDGLPFPPSKSLELSRHHRIIRRGRKYGEGRGQGICFIALNADLRRQFEFIQQTWLNNPTFNGLDDDKDPIAGDNANDCGEFTIQAKPVNKHVYGLQRFVTVQGGGYFFLPGIRALKFLASDRLAATRARDAQPPSL